MALAKLWNAFFGKSAAKADAALSPSPAGMPGSSGGLTVKSRSAAAPSRSGVIAGDGATVRLSRRKTKSHSERRSPDAARLEVVAPTPAVRIFQRKNNAWTKLIGPRTVRSILDLNLGDGSRAVELLESIADSDRQPPKYIAIGLFELAGDGLTVCQFHRKIRLAGGQPVAIPMPLGEGLRRLSQSIGKVDLLLLEGADPQWSDPAVTRWLQRIVTAETLILRRDAGRWRSASETSRKAA